jgi:protein-S-isoprenylcysteine O-methyltransferase Ste14
MNGWRICRPRRDYARDMPTRLPSLGPRGEGWLALQVALMAAVILGAAIQVSPGPEGATRLLLDAIGWIALLGGVALIIWSTTLLQANRALSATPRPLAGSSLVETGPYRLVRHPIYLGLIVAGIGAAASRTSLVSLAATVALAIVLDLKRRREEAWLVEQFPEYAGYRQRTKALIPFVY